MKVIHYNNALNPQKFSIPLCRPNIEAKSSTKRLEVTCKNCRKMFDHKAKS